MTQIQHSQVNRDGEREKAGEAGRIYKCQQHINHLALVYLAMKAKCCILSFFLMTPIYLFHLHLISADSNGAEKKTMFSFSGFHFSHQHYSIAPLLDPFTATSSILMFCPAQQVWQHYSEHISTLVVKEAHVLSSLLTGGEKKAAEIVLNLFFFFSYWKTIIKKLFVRLEKKMSNTLHRLWVLQF